MDNWNNGVMESLDLDLILSLILMGLVAIEYLFIAIVFPGCLQHSCEVITLFMLGVHSAHTLAPLIRVCMQLTQNAKKNGGIICRMNKMAVHHHSAQLIPFSSLLTSNPPPISTRRISLHPPPHRPLYRAYLHLRKSINLTSLQLNQDRLRMRDQQIF